MYMALMVWGVFLIIKKSRGVNWSVVDDIYGAKGILLYSGLFNYKIFTAYMYGFNSQWCVFTLLKKLKRC